MEIEKTEQQGRDTFVLLDDFLHQAKRMWLLGLALILICAAGLTPRGKPLVSTPSSRA